MKGNCVIVDFVRTPMCAMGGALKQRTSQQIAKDAMLAIMNRTGLKTEDLDHVICGHAHMDTNPYNLARTAWLLTELDVNTPGYTVHACGASGLLALQKAYYLFQTGNDLTAIVGGAESYSTAPFILRDARYLVDLDASPVVDSIREGERWTQPEPLDPRVLAKQLAEKRGYSEAQILEEIAAEKSRMDAVVWEAHIAPVSWEERKKGTVSIASDAPANSAATLAAYSDGAAMMLCCEEERAKQLGFKPKARILGFASAATAPDNRTEGAVLAAKKLMKRFDSIPVSDIGSVEIIADGSVTTLAITDDLAAMGFDRNSVNPLGGCLAYGVNEGADGVIAAERSILHLARTGSKYGLVTAATSGGQGMAMLIEVI
ncbi:MAG: hypothetical protein E7330_00535 [Clostridiales bacterium]|nr:hypothetical protein [Clostridiales bacterium]